MSLYEVFETPTHVELVLELMQGGELYHRISTKGPYEEADVSFVIAGCWEGR